MAAPYLIPANFRSFATYSPTKFVRLQSNQRADIKEPRLLARLRNQSASRSALFVKDAGKVTPFALSIEINIFVYPA